MKILLTNDDGYRAKGIKILEKSLKDYGDVYVAAPYKNMSACSSSLSVHSKVNIISKDDRHYVIKGTPADCIHLLSRGIMQSLPDIVFSGINFGSNLGDDVIYSGTVAGAIEGRFCKYSPVAISIVSREPKYLNDIDSKMNFILSYIFKNIPKLNTILNINIPDIPFSKIKGIKYTILGNRNISMRPIITKSSYKIHGEIGAVGKPLFSSKETDFNAIKDKYISFTPITINMHDTKSIKNKVIKNNKR